ncbi:hypothetical protein ACWN8V_09930 [Vagococcus elongatus]
MTQLIIHFLLTMLFVFITSYFNNWPDFF